MKSSLEHYWGVVRERLPMIILISVTVAVAALFAAKQVKPSHEVHFSYLISLSARDPSQDFRFDGYYALQATDLFAATLARWVATPEVVVAAHQEANLELPSDDPRALARIVKAEKVAPQLVTVTVRGATREEAAVLAEGVRRVMEHNVARYHNEGVPAVSFAVVSTEAWSGVVRLSVLLVVTAAFLFTFLVTLNGVLLVESLKNRESGI